MRASTRFTSSRNETGAIAAQSLPADAGDAHRRAAGRPDVVDVRAEVRRLPRHHRHRGRQAGHVEPQRARSGAALSTDRRGAAEDQGQGGRARRRDRGAR